MTTDPTPAWIAEVCTALGLDPALMNADRTARMLDLVRDVAHEVARPAAPVTAFLVGLAAGRAGGDAAQVDDAVATTSALVRPAH